MKTRALTLFFFLVLSLNFGARTATCGLQQTGISRDQAIKLFTDANEKHLQAAKLVAAKNNQEANQKLGEAASQYEAILAGGFQHGQIYYNLGNTYYRQGELGKAIANYRRAQRLLPRNADLEANLRLAKSSAEDTELSGETPVVIQRVFFWFFLLNHNELAILTITLYVILMVLLFLSIVFKYAWLKKFILGFSAGLFIAAASLGIKTYREQWINHGVVISPQCQVRYGPGEEYEPKFEIHNGAECIIESEKDDWYKVYVNVGVKRNTDPKMSANEAGNKEMSSGWLQKKNVDVINSQPYRLQEKA